MFIQDTPGDIGSYLVDRIEARPEKPRGSVHSLRRGSFDVRSIGSDNMRRTSLAKLHAMPLEAPITKVNKLSSRLKTSSTLFFRLQVISLICSVQESANPESCKMLDKVIDILRSTELYSPNMKEDHRVRAEDPVTNDLIGALLTVKPLSSYRSNHLALLFYFYSKVSYKIYLQEEVVTILLSSEDNIGIQSNIK